jgi:hypothetical protein
MLYHGDKSLDAEITMDLKTGEITMDYSLNKIASPYNSNTSAILKDEYRDLQRKNRFVETVKKVPLTILYGCYMIFTVPIVTFVLSKGLVKNHQYQIEHQHFMKWIFMNTLHSYQEIREGPLESSKLTVGIPNNLWMEYHLDGEYKDKIKSIELKRHFITRKKFGVYTQIVQRGWDLIFTFDGIPASGKCIIEHT